MRQYSPVSSQHVIVDDDLEVAPIYRCGGKVEKPVRPPTGFMTCALNGRLKGWGVIVSNLLWQKEFLYLDHLPLNQNMDNAIAQMA